MFSKSKVKNLLFFDLECVGSTNTLEEQSERIQALWSKRCEWLKSKEGEEKTESELWETNAGLHPEFGKIIVASFGYFEEENGELKPIIKSYAGDDEHSILTDVKKLLTKTSSLGYVLCGHNIRNFDIPYLAKRMVMSRINPPNILQVHDKKPWEVSILDTQEIWSFGSYGQKHTSLDLLSASLGLPSPKEDMHGSEVHSEFYSTGKDIERIQKYCETDVLTVMNVVNHMSTDSFAS